MFSYEFGVEMRFFNGCIGVDFFYYNQIIIDQIILLVVFFIIGYFEVLINVGEMNNKGFEVFIYGIVLKFNSGLNWDVVFNFVQNRSEVVELFIDVNGNELEMIVLYLRRGLSLEVRVG